MRRGASKEILVESAIIELFNKQRKEADETQNKWSSLRQCYLPLLKRLEKLKPELEFSKYGYLRVDVSGDAHTITAVIRALRTSGFKAEGFTPPKKNTSSFSVFFTQEEAPYTQVYLTFCSTVCKVVQVGTKMVEQPVYETVCGGEVENV